MDYTQRGSSPIDWCENNYKWTSHIAEFFNTISNAIFFLIPPLLMHFFKDYARHVSYGIHAIWFMLIMVGAGSVYFHATLTMAGQLMDELSILWVLMTSFTVLYPEKYLPIYFHKNKNQWYFMFLTATIFITYLCFLNPYLNAYFLMLFIIPVLAMLYFMVRRCSIKKIVRLSKRTCVIGISAVTLWIMDRVFCDIWVKLNIPYLHSIFHVLVFFSSYYAIVIFAYFTADFRVPNLKPTIYYWPSNKKKYEFLCIPYVYFKKLYRPDDNDLSSNSSDFEVESTAGNEKGEITYKFA